MTEKASEVIMDISLQITPRFGLPRSQQGDNGPLFKVAVTQGVSKALEIQYH
jgi:hypothetical protein